MIEEVFETLIENSVEIGAEGIEALEEIGELFAESGDLTGLATLETEAFYEVLPEIAEIEAVGHQIEALELMEAAVPEIVQSSQIPAAEAFGEWFEGLEALETGYLNSFAEAQINEATCTLAGWSFALQEAGIEMSQETIMERAAEWGLYSFEGGTAGNFSMRFAQFIEEATGGSISPTEITWTPQGFGETVKDVVLSGENVILPIDPSILVETADPSWGHDVVITHIEDGVAHIMDPAEGVFDTIDYDKLIQGAKDFIGNTRASLLGRSGAFSVPDLIDRPFTDVI